MNLVVRVKPAIFNCAMASCLWALGAAHTAAAQNATIPEEYGKHIQQRSTIAALGSDLFGDQVDLNSGSLEIVQSDVEVPGNNALSVRLGRRYKAGVIYRQGHFDDWDLDIPNAHGVFSSVRGDNGGTDVGWTVPSPISADRHKRCSGFSTPPQLSYLQGHFNPEEYWQGNFVYLPGFGDQEMLSTPLTTAHVPNDGHTYPIVTRQGAAVRCVALAATSAQGSRGEGFEVVAPDGTVYTLNQMVTRLERRLAKGDSTPMFDSAGPPQQQSNGGATQPLVPVDFILPRIEVLLYPTKVTDRHGNTVTYSWNPQNEWQLQQILASDGRHLDFTYESATSPLVANVSDGTRFWTYTYGTTLSTLTLPDLSVWTYQLQSLSRSAIAHPQNVTCDNLVGQSGSYTGSITGPSGAKAEFTLAPVKFGRSWVFRECVRNVDDSEYVREPYVFLSMAVTSRKITGSGLSATGLNWTYNYGAPNQCWDPASVPAGTIGAILCTASSPTTRLVSVLDPENVTTRYTYGNRSRVDEGLLLRTDYGWNGTSALRTETIKYADPEAAPYAAFNGNSIRNLGDYDLTSRYRPQRQVITTQQGRDFTWEVATGCSNGYCFDAFARPTKIIKSSAQSP